MDEGQSENLIVDGDVVVSESEETSEHINPESKTSADPMMEAFANIGSAIRLVMVLNSITKRFLKRDILLGK
jgi:hypothetical protein